MSGRATTVKVAATMHNPAHPGEILRELYDWWHWRELPAPIDTCVWISLGGRSAFRRASSAQYRG
jgi:hypothetical protein